MQKVNLSDVEKKAKSITGLKKLENCYNHFTSSGATWEENNKITEKFKEQLEKYGDDFFINNKDEVKILLGETYSKYFFQILSFLPEVIYGFSYSRRSFRSKKIPVLYIDKKISIISSLFKAYTHGVELMEYFKSGYQVTNDDGSSYNLEIVGMGYCLACELDNNSRPHMEMVREAIYENSTTKISYPLIKAICNSGNAICYKYLEDLLIAAKLQEGLRQSIFESMDEGREAAFMHILKVIIDNDLSRFSSAIRAFGTWTGLDLTVEKPKLIKELFASYYEVMQNPNIDYSVQDASEHNMKLYLSFWSIAFREVADAINFAKRLFFSDIKKHQKELVLSFLNNMYGSFQLQDFYMKILMESTDLNYRLIAIRCLNLQYRQDKSIVTRELFETVYSISEEMKGKEITIENPSPLNSYTIDKSSIYGGLISIAEDLDKEDIFKTLEQSEKQILGYNKTIYLRAVVESDSYKDKIPFLLKHAGGNDYAVQQLGKMELLPENYEQLEDVLKSKSSRLRRNIIDLLLKQDNIGLAATAKRLVGNKNDNKVSAALDIINICKSDEKRRDVYMECLPIVQALPELSSDDMVLVKQILEENATVNSIIDESVEYKVDENSFVADYNLPFLKDASKKSLLGIFKSKKDVAKDILPPFEPNNKASNPFKDYLFTCDAKRMKLLVDKIEDVLEAHPNYVYSSINRDGKQLADQVFSLSSWYLPTLDYRKPQSIGNIPLGKEISAAVGDMNLTVMDAIHLWVYGCGDNFASEGRERLSWHKTEPHKSTLWQKKYRQQIYNDYKISVPTKLNMTKKLLLLLSEELFKSSADEAFQFFYNLMLYQYNQLPLKNIQDEIEVGERKELSYSDVNMLDGYDLSRVRAVVVEYARTKEQHKKLYDHYQACRKYVGDNISTINKEKSFVHVQSLFMEQIIDENELYKGILYGGWANLLRDYSNKMKKELVQAEKEEVEATAATENETVDVETTDDLDGDLDEALEVAVEEEEEIKTPPDDPAFMEALRKFVYFVVDEELKRGETDTIYSRLAQKINYFEGTEYFARIAISLGKQNLVRGRSFSWGKPSKNEMFSHLLTGCLAKKGEDEKTLAKHLKGEKIRESLLIDMALYSPSFVDMVGEYIKIKNFNVVCWYFLCHVNQTYEKRIEKNIVKYTSFTPEELQDGAFDPILFEKAYSVGAELFDKVYDSAKYIAEGSTHRRAQIFADVRLGRITEDAILEKINTTRNKDFVLAYGTLPLKDTTKDALCVYERLQLFLKESRKFGSQRQASEKRVHTVALANLAKNAGYGDVNQFVWFMESAKIKEYQHFFKPNKIGDIEVWIEVSAEGTPSLTIKKGGKSQKTLPKTIAKDDYVLDLKDYLKSLKDQEKRAKELFEKSMINEDIFDVADLENIKAHVIINKIITKLVFSNKKQMGFLAGKNELQDFSGNIVKLKKGDKLKISHPVDIYDSGKWADYQKYVMENQIAQPFKQVFRELYLPTKDELKEDDKARRYAGHQVQPRRANALFKTRGWSVGFEGEVEKVYYGTDTVVNIYIQGDLFSPSDVEYPTLEFATFYHRITQKPLKISELNKVMFSETMRDIDLVVSVAHAGDVDPEASQSTIEMRGAILTQLIPLLKLDNVSIDKTFVRVKGTMGEYAVHLGSGQVFRNSVSLGIFAIQSQHRGKIFLPFVDEDPRTAEIMSKVLLLAKDNEIKDPTILSQLQG